jgi:glycosyltransferase involved in cell wall biosynthesis
VDDKLTIVIPAYNEELGLGAVLNEIKLECGDFVEEIILVDDGSTDQTGSIGNQQGVHVIRHSSNKGYGAALKSGIRAAKTEFILTLDADGQHQAVDIARLWNARADFDMVVGQRTSLIHSPLWRMPGKWLLGMIANYLTRRHIPDLNSGLRLMKRSLVTKYMHVCPSGFSFSTTITIALLTEGYYVNYIPIQVRKRQGKSTVSFSTGMQTIILIIRIAALFDPLRIFLPLSAMIALIGILWGVPYLLLGNGISIGAMLAIVTSVLIFCLGILCDQISQLRLERYR